MSSEGKFDGVLMSIAQQQHGIEPLLSTVFSFLRRKTDFFSGASAEVIEATVLKTLREQSDLASREKKIMEEKKRRQEKENLSVKVPKIEEIKDEPEKETPAVTEIQAIEKPVSKISEETVDDDEESGPGPVGNGGSTANYVWTQTLQEVQLTIPVPEGTKSKQVQVSIKPKKLRAGLKGQEPLKINGDLFNKVIVEDSFWTLEDSSRICIYLQKENKMEWWKCAIQGDPEIDTKKVQPENSNLSDLDADTRQTVEKMMFDQRQKAMGKPTSDEMKKNEMLQKFMAQHPEMDFSKAKIN